MCLKSWSEKFKIATHNAPRPCNFLCIPVIIIHLIFKRPSHLTASQFYLNTNLNTQYFPTIAIFSNHPSLTRFLNDQTILSCNTIPTTPIIHHISATLRPIKILFHSNSKSAICLNQVPSRWTCSSRAQRRRTCSTHSPTTLTTATSATRS